MSSHTSLVLPTMSDHSGGTVEGCIVGQLNVLLVDDDATCLVMLEKMLRDCNYQVVKCQSGEEALSMLKENKDAFDIIMSDVRMPNIDGLRLLAEIAEMQIDSPVILFSEEPEYDAITKGINNGACDFLVKPIQMGTIKVLWKNLLHHRSRKFDNEKERPSMPITYSVLCSDQQISLSNEKPAKLLKRKGGSDTIDNSIIKEAEQDNSNVSTAMTMKKPRVSWTSELHNAFIDAIERIGLEKALPKKILEYMEQEHEITGLTRQVISSHLQKHRANKRKNEATLSGPNIGSTSTGCSVMPSSLPVSSQNLSYISWDEAPGYQGQSRHEYAEPIYQMEPQINQVGSFPRGCFGHAVDGAFNTFLPSQPPYQIPWNSGVGSMICGQSVPGICVSSMIETLPIKQEMVTSTMLHNNHPSRTFSMQGHVPLENKTLSKMDSLNIYNIGTELVGQQLPIGSSTGVYQSCKNESCSSNRVALEGEFELGCKPTIAAEQGAAEGLLIEAESLFEASLLQNNAYW